MTKTELGLKPTPWTIIIEPIKRKVSKEIWTPGEENNNEAIVLLAGRDTEAKKGDWIMYDEKKAVQQLVPGRAEPVFFIRDDAKVALLGTEDDIDHETVK